MRASKRKVCIVTGTRADYGLFLGLLREVQQSSRLELQVIATGAHLEKRFGMTCRQIESDGFPISACVPMGLTTDTDIGITLSAGKALGGIGKAIARLSPDIVVLLGDRFETLSAAAAATLMRTPIAHIHGGEVTEGAYDEVIRHSVTKLAQLPFVTHAEHARRGIQMGGFPSRVFNVGAPGLDNIRMLPLMNKVELEKNIDFRLGPDVVLVTFHPVTMQKGAAGGQIRIVLNALEKAGVRCVFTMPNADPENGVIRREILQFSKRKGDAVRVLETLGSLRYLSLMKYAGAMVGNSSSGLIEAPSFRLPVVNIGDRQKGRLRAANVIDVANDTGMISQAIGRALSSEFRSSIRTLKNPYGDGRASMRIRKVLETVSLEGLCMKPFFDIRAGAA